MAYKGKFKPDKPEKYLGDPNNIIYRSLWEAHLFMYLDKHPYVEKWASEEIVIPYYSPVDKKMHRYYPDVFVKIRNPKTNTLRSILIEVKPYKQTLEPDVSKKNSTKTGRVSRSYLNEVKRYAVNKAKWDAASEYCMDRGFEFMILTEKDLGL